MKKFKKGFTLAEVMIVLTVIGIISAIIMPNVGKLVSSDNKNIARFKKGHNDFLQVMDTIIKSDKYYVPGDLGIRPSGDAIDGNHEGDITYFCKSFADNLRTKKVNCSTKGRLYSDTARDSGNFEIASSAMNADATRIDIGASWVTSSYNDSQKALDEICKFNEVLTNEDEIVTSDGITYYQGSPAVVFGVYITKINGIKNNYFTYDPTEGDVNSKRAFDTVSNGYKTGYKIFCMDIDGKNNGEDPFGYGIRIDGKIVNGNRAQEWLNKGIN